MSLAALLRRSCAVSLPSAPRAAGTSRTLVTRSKRGGPIGRTSVENTAVAWRHLQDFRAAALGRVESGTSGEAPVGPTRADDPYEPRPLFSRAARRERLMAALSRAAEGQAFEVAKAEDSAMPGPCGAVMNVLKESPVPLKTDEILAACEERYPGVIKDKTHLKRSILMDALVHKLMRVALDGRGSFRNRWRLRRKGELRMAMSRKLLQHKKARLPFGPNGKFTRQHHKSRAR